MLYQYWALLVKRFHYSRRKPLAFFVQNLLPVVVIGFSLAIAHAILAVSDPPPLLLAPSMFFRVSPENYAFVGNNPAKASLDYTDTLFQPCGLGAELLASGDDSSSPCYWDRPPDTCAGYPDSEYLCPLCNCSSRADLPSSKPACFNGTVVR